MGARIATVVFLASLMLSLATVAGFATMASACRPAPGSPASVCNDPNLTQMMAGEPAAEAAVPDVSANSLPAGGGSPQQGEEPEAEHKDVPWIPILILALAIPTAALVIPAFFMARKPHE